MKSLSSITSIESYVQAFSGDLADKVTAQSEPLHTPTADNRSTGLKSMTTKAFDKQSDLISGCVKSLKQNRLAILACQMGTGKSMMGIGTVHCHSNGKPYRAVVLCPPHLVTKWKSEIHKFLGAGPKAVIISNWEEFLALRYLPPPQGAEWYIMAMTTAKLGYDKRCAGVPKIVTVDTDTGPQKMHAYTCPRCAYPAFNSKKHIATQKNIEDGWLKCIGKWCKKCGVSRQHDYKLCPGCGSEVKPCGEPLWQARSHKVAPVQYVKSKGVRWFRYCIHDEAHTAKSADSIEGNTSACFAQHAKYTLLMTGTLLAGKSEDLRPMLFRLKPRGFIDLGFGWKDEIPFGEQYGRIETVVRTSEGGSTKRRSGKGSSKTTTRNIKPGIMPQLFPDFVSNYTVFMSLPELAVNLPSYHEETKAIDMDPLMRAEYDNMKKKCLDAFRYLYQNNRKLAVKLLGPMLEAFMTWPDVPYGRKAVGYTNEEGQYHAIYQPADFDQTIIYPKEKELMEYLNNEKKLGRKCWVFSVRDDVRDRLQIILEAHGYKVAALKATVKPSTRIDWIAKHAPSCDVGLSHPQLVETGLELFGPGFNFPTLLWYSTGFRLNTLRQASRRSWRIGQPKDCKTVYFYYSGSAQHTAIGLMASKLVAAEAIEGKFSDGGLADESADEDVALAVARHMAEGIQVTVQSRYKPVEAASTEADRIQILRNKFASLGEKLRRYKIK